METYSHSPRVAGPDTASLRAYDPNPITPTHSPHTSIRSSLSLRTPVHTLTLHEYRKQQSTPIPRIETPPGKTLRRKVAAFALNELERVPSVTRTSQSDSRSSLRPLHPSQSAHQLSLQKRSSEPQPISDQSFRSRSADPRVQSGSVPGVITTNTTSKFCQFGARKRLPRPAALGSGTHSLSIDTAVPNHSAQPPQLAQPSVPSRASLFTDESRLSDAQSITTLSKLSLSRFPRPPQLTDLSFSPPPDKKDSSRVNAFSFATTAPATPPATPAIIHYRGASFDLINPHDSLLYHDIVTPSRDLDSSEYLPVRSSEECYAISEEMAPKRALYGDFSAAHAGIMRRAEDSFDLSNIHLPLPPTPAAISPSSSDYTSPFYSPESNFAPSPLDVRKPAIESRFSLKSLTRSLTKRLVKSQDEDYEEELREFHEPILRAPSAAEHDPYPQPLDPVYVPAPTASYFPASPVSPLSPMSPEFSQESALLSHHAYDDQSAPGCSRLNSVQEYASEGLTSLIPDDPSTQVGRSEGSRISMIEEENVSRPYYDDLESIYASSSVYTGNEQRRSRHEHSLASNRQSRAFLRFSDMDASDHVHEYSYRNLRRTSRRTSRPLIQDLYRRSVAQETGKADTISKFIDQYDPDNMTDNTLSLWGDGATHSLDVAKSDSADVEEELRTNDLHPTQEVADNHQSEFGTSQNNRALRRRESMPRIRPVLATKRASIRGPGIPLDAPAPLAPAFEYDEMPYPIQPPAPSDLFSRASDYSYGDTRNLLLIPPPEETFLPAFQQELQPSSSYSQPEATAIEPSSSYSQNDGEDALDCSHYEVDGYGQPSGNVTAERAHADQEIPAMWTRRDSVSRIHDRRRSHRSSTGYNLGEDKGDWETVDGDSQQSRASLDSIANYSSSEEGGLLNSDQPLPRRNQTKYSQGFLDYIHSRPLRPHAHPFGSSPPPLDTRINVRAASEILNPMTTSSPPTSKTAPLFCYRPRPIDFLGNGIVEEPRDTSGPSPYALSDKETQELLASGPNDDILFDTKPDRNLGRYSVWFKSHDNTPISSPSSSLPDHNGLQCANTFEKLSAVGPKGNLTGTSRGTGMHAAGSSIADISSPRAGLSCSASRQSSRSEHSDFYACPFPATGSVTRIQQLRVYPHAQFESSPSEVTLFPSGYNHEPVQPSSPLSGPNHRASLRNSTKFRRPRQPSRTAVPGQTKLREMVLASGPRSSSSSHETHLSQFMRAVRSERPSTSDTTTPLRTEHPSMNAFPTSQPIITHTYSPHLLCPHREVQPEDEERRRKLSWLIFAMFCIFPPCMFLFRAWGDSIVVSLTKGQLGHCTPKSKRVALIAGILVNLGLITALLVPVLVVQALKPV